MASTLQLLCYSGILQEGDAGIRLHGQPGTRYMVNLGCLFSQDSDPLAFGEQVRQSLSVRKMVEFTPVHDFSAPPMPDSSPARTLAIIRPSGLDSKRRST
jgi:hypothetical protein